MQKLIACMLLLLTFQSYAQQANFTKKVFSCEFNNADKPFWPLRNNSGFNFNIENGKYIIECLDEKKIAYAPLKWDEKPENYKVEINLSFEKGMQGIVGFAYGADENLQSGYILQFDKYARYRICMIDAGMLKVLTGDRKNGWEDFKKVSAPGKNNKLDIMQTDGKIVIYINDASLISYHNHLKSLKGGFGFRLDGRAGAQVNDFTIFGPGAAPVDSILLKATQAQKIVKKDTVAAITVKRKDTLQAGPSKPVQINKEAAMPTQGAMKPLAKTRKESKKKADAKPSPNDNSIQAKDTTKEEPQTKELITKASPRNQKAERAAKAAPTEVPNDSSRNLLTLGIALGDARKENQKLKTDRDNYVAELKQIKQKNEELQAFINKNLDVKLKNELDIQRSKNEILSNDNEKLKEENSGLKSFKEQITKAKDGDIIVMLSENLKTEQKKNEDLNKKIKEMEERAKAKPWKATAPGTPKPVNNSPTGAKPGQTPAKPVTKPDQKP